MVVVVDIVVVVDVVLPVLHEVADALLSLTAYIHNDKVKSVGEAPDKLLSGTTGPILSPTLVQSFKSC